MGTWVCMHDKVKEFEGMDIWAMHPDVILRPVLATRPAERYQAWKLTFELVKE